MWQEPRERRPPNNSMEPPPLPYGTLRSRSGALRPIPASRTFGFCAILPWLAGRLPHRGAPQISRPLGAPTLVPRGSIGGDQ